MSNNAEPAGAQRPSIFKASKLSSVANELWSKSKSEWKPVNKVDSFAFAKGGLKLGGETEEKNQAPTGPFGGHVFGTKKEKSNDKEPNEEVISADSIFKKFAANDAKKENDANAQCSTSGSLEASVAEFVKQKKDDENQVGSDANITTGEESEINIYQVTGKLYFYDTEQKSWVERGMSNLRINQNIENESHRLVCRAIGNQRVIINSAFFANMIVEKISNRRLKFSANCPDFELPQLFFFQCSDASMERLYDVVSELHRACKEAEVQSSRKRKGETEDSECEAPKRAALSHDDSAEGDKVESNESAEEEGSEDSSPNSTPKSDSCEIVKTYSTSEED